MTRSAAATAYDYNNREQKALTVWSLWRSRPSWPFCIAIRFISAPLEPEGASSVLFGIDAWEEDLPMDGIIYLVGLIVIVLAILSFFGLR